MAKTIPLHASLKPKYKYRFSEIIDDLPKSFSNNQILDHLDKNGISKAEFYRDRNIEFRSEQSIPSDRMKKYAIIFDVSEDDLMNHTITAKPLRQVDKKKIKTDLR